MRFWLFEVLGDFARRRRARKAAAAFGDPDLREAAERVYFFVDRVAGVAPSSLDLDAPLASVVARTIDQEFWDRTEIVIGQGEPKRLHVIENVRSGSARHLMNHLCICPVCRN